MFPRKERSLGAASSRPATPSRRISGLPCSSPWTMRAISAVVSFMAESVFSLGLPQLFQKLFRQVHGGLAVEDGSLLHHHADSLVARRLLEYLVDFSQEDLAF